MDETTPPLERALTRKCEMAVFDAAARAPEERYLRTQLAREAGYKSSTVYRQMDDLLDANLLEEHQTQEYQKYSLADSEHAHHLRDVVRNLPVPLDEALGAATGVATVAVLAESQASLQPSEIARNCQRSKRAVQNHLPRLVDLGFIDRIERDGSWTAYRLAGSPLGDAVREANAALAAAYDMEIVVERFRE